MTAVSHYPIFIVTLLSLKIEIFIQSGRHVLWKFPLLALSAWPLQFSPTACGTLRKHVTKPFQQPAAPDCTTVLNAVVYEPGSMNGLVLVEAATEGTWNGVANGARLLSSETTLCCRLWRERLRSLSRATAALAWPASSLPAVDLDFGVCPLVPVENVA